MRDDDGEPEIGTPAFVAGPLVVAALVAPSHQDGWTSSAISRASSSVRRTGISLMLQLLVRVVDHEVALQQVVHHAARRAGTSRSPRPLLARGGSASRSTTYPSCGIRHQRCRRSPLGLGASSTMPYFASCRRWRLTEFTGSPIEAEISVGALASREQLVDDGAPRRVGGGTQHAGIGVDVPRHGGSLASPR